MFLMEDTVFFFHFLPSILLFLIIFIISSPLLRYEITSALLRDLVTFRHILFVIFSCSPLLWTSSIFLPSLSPQSPSHISMPLITISSSPTSYSTLTLKANPTLLTLNSSYGYAHKSRRGQKSIESIVIMIVMM